MISIDVGVASHLQTAVVSILDVVGMLFILEYLQMRSKTEKEVIYVESGQFDREFPDPNPYLREATTKEREKHNRLYKTYGLTLLEWQQMLREQGYACWICKEMPKSKILCVDHVHKKGFKVMEPEEKLKYVRGLLCYKCNTGLKGFDKTCNGEENRRRLCGTYDYFKEFPLKGEI